MLEKASSSSVLGDLLPNSTKTSSTHAISSTADTQDFNDVMKEQQSATAPAHAGVSNTTGHDERSASGTEIEPPATEPLGQSTEDTVYPSVTAEFTSIANPADTEIALKLSSTTLPNDAVSNSTELPLTEHFISPDNALPTQWQPMSVTSDAAVAQLGLAWKATTPTANTSASFSGLSTDAGSVESANTVLNVNQLSINPSSSESPQTSTMSELAPNLMAVSSSSVLSVGLAASQASEGPISILPQSSDTQHKINTVNDMTVSKSMNVPDALTPETSAKSSQITATALSPTAIATGVETLASNAKNALINNANTTLNTNPDVASVLSEVAESLPASATEKPNGRFAQAMNPMLNTNTGPSLSTQLATPFSQQSQWQVAVTEKVMWLSAQDLKQAEIQLDPPELGPLQVKISVNNDQAHVSFNVNSTSVKEALDQNALRLRDSFDEAGLDLVDVDVSDRQPSDDNESDSDSKSAQDHSSFNEDGDSSSVTETTLRVSNRLVDAYI